MEQKLLSICIPTYNRSKCINEQLNRLIKLPVSVREKVEIIVSDNCSTDNTIEVIESFKEKLEFVYNRNATNLGFDGNFLYLYNHAKGKYIWILSDDDYLLQDKIETLLDCLKNSDYGLIHINNRIKNQNMNYKVYEDHQRFIEDIGIWITFITANIINRKAIGTFDYQKYYGTCFLQVPQNLMSIINNERNLMYYHHVIDDTPSVNKNGGYNLFEVFVSNYINIFRDFHEANLMSENLYKKEIRISKKFVIPFVFKILIKKEKTAWSYDGAWDILNKYYGYWHIRWELIIYVIKLFLSRFRFQ